jgi:cytoskeletal protein RodZ
MTQQAQQTYQAPEPDLDHYHDLSVGEILQRTREYYGQTIPQVEVNLRIRADHLNAIEQGDVANLPGRVYAIGFVRAYAEYLGLDGDKIVHLFKSQTIGKKAKPKLQFPVTYRDTKTPNAYIIFGCLAGLVLLIAYWSVTYKPSHHIEVIPPVPEELKQGSVPLLKQEDIEKINESAKEPDSGVLSELFSGPKNKMELVVSQDSWVEVKNADGETLLSQILKPGDKYIVPDEKGLTLSTGNAGGITVFIEGKKIGPLGRTTEVRRNIDLNPKNFK